VRVRNRQVPFRDPASPCPVICRVPRSERDPARCPLNADRPRRTETVLQRLRAATPRRLRRLLDRLRGRPGGTGELFEVAYVFLVSDQLNNYVRKAQVELEARHGRNLALSTVPHITLKLGVPAGSLEPFERHFDRLVAEVEPFEVCVQGFDFFEEGIIFLGLEPQPRLEELRRRILSELSEQLGIEPYDLEKGDRYRFHVTVAHGLTPVEFERARHSLDRETPRFRFTVDRMGLFCYTRDFWFTYRLGACRHQGALT
jgi:2'-5' RNA ligase